MHGVPQDLDLSAFSGARLDHVTLCEFQLVFFFDPTATITALGAWELLDRAGEVIDSGREGANHDACKLQQCVGKTVADSFLASPTSFALRFDDGSALRFIDDTPGSYESVLIEPGGIVI